MATKGGPVLASAETLTRLAAAPDGSTVRVIDLRALLSASRLTPDSKALKRDLVEQVLRLLPPRASTAAPPPPPLPSRPPPSPPSPPPPPPPSSRRHGVTLACSDSGCRPRRRESKGAPSPAPGVAPHTPAPGVAPQTPAPGVAPRADAGPAAELSTRAREGLAAELKGFDGRTGGATVSLLKFVSGGYGHTILGEASIAYASKKLQVAVEVDEDLLPLQFDSVLAARIESIWTGKAPTPADAAARLRTLGSLGQTVAELASGVTLRQRAALGDLLERIIGASDTRSPAYGVGAPAAGVDVKFASGAGGPRGRKVSLRYWTDFGTRDTAVSRNFFASVYPSIAALAPDVATYWSRVSER